MSLDNFQGTQTIEIQPTTTKATYTFRFAACSSATANDGSIPYGTSVSSVVVKAYDEDGEVATTSLIVGTPTVAANVVSISFKWPGTAGDYKVSITYTLSNDDVDEVDFARVSARDK